MSDDQSFLARWSRRKRDAAAGRQDAPKPVPETGPAAPPVATDAPPPTETAAVDAASLPPLESIGAGSDVRAFLQAGVPADLTRAALRRAWSSDPAIREFIGLSENAWDFNAAGSMAGFGPVTADEVRRLVAHMTDLARDETAQAADTAGAAADPAPAAANAANPGQDQARDEQEPTEIETPLPHRDKGNTALQQNADNDESELVLVRRGHGGAVPQ